MNRKLFLIGLACLIALFLMPHFVHAQNTRPIVRLIYFLPKDRKPQPDIDAKFDKWIKDVQQLYANQMEAHGFGRKTFQFETDASGKAVVHRFVGQFTDEHYSNLSYTWDIWGEIDKQFDASKNIYVTVIDMSSEYIDRGRAGGRGGSWGSAGGKVLTTIVPNTDGIIAHEIAHAFGLFHDKATSNAKRISIFVEDLMINSFCTAEWLDAHRAFNPGQSAENEPTKIQMLPPSLASPPNVIRLRFEISDPNGIHQVQLLAPMPLYHGDLSLLGCKSLNGNISGTVEFATDDLTPKTGRIRLQVIDVLGNMDEPRTFPIDITSIIPLSETISIPDPHLAAAIQREIGNITTHSILNLHRLDASNSKITDLTGIEHASSLIELYLQRNANSNTTLDLSPLSGLTNLNRLNLSDNNISDISALSELKNLTTLLGLSGNNIIDVSALSGLKNLIYLELRDNNITDISALSGLQNLTHLKISDNNITDISGLTNIRNLLLLNLQRNPLSYESIHTHIPVMQARGTSVTFDNITHPELHLISGDKQIGFVGSILSSPFVVEYRDAQNRPKGGTSVSFSIRDGEGELTDSTVTTDADGRAQTILHLGWKVGAVTVRATAEGVISPLTITASAILPENHVPEDVNADGIVNVEDLVLVAATIGTTPPEGTYPNPDVNGDGVVNHDDLALVMAALENTPTAPTVVLTAENMQRWIDEAKKRTNKDETYLKGITVLEQLLVSLLPEKTLLLANYPNPFNPETWIPYHLAKPATVTVHIYAVNGRLIRTLSLGHKSAGIYEHRNRAAYWDGCNAQGESVAGGIYFYTLTAGDYTSTRKMLIWK